MNIEEWIKENSKELVDFDSLSTNSVISVNCLRELLKTHAIVPRDPSWDMQVAGEKVPQFSEDIYKAMIKAAESE